MTTKSKGPQRRTRNLFRGPRRLTVNDRMREFIVGEKVGIKINSAIQSARPFRRFQGRTGTIAERRGNSYVVDIVDGSKAKKINTTAEHLKRLL